MTAAHPRATGTDLSAQVRVCSIPTVHPYVNAVTGDGDVVTVAPAVVAGAGVWAPSAALTPTWVEQNARLIDLVHLHFGFDAYAPAQLAEWTRTLARHGLPLVQTVHDLHNPHVVDPARHLAQLDVLVPAAARVLTLTAGAAEQIHQRWGVRAEVTPHPQVVPDRWLTTPRPRHDGFVVGLHLKGLRANVSGPETARALAVAVAELGTAGARGGPERDGPPARLQVFLNTEATDPEFLRYDADLLEWLRAADAGGDLDLVVHDRPDDDALWGTLQSLDLSVLPYRFGTHSGWLEACHDLGTAVLAPRVGHWHEQHPCEGYDLGPDGSPVQGSLSAAVARAHATWRRGEIPRADPAQRGRQRVDVARFHRDLYRAVAATGSPE